MIGPSPTKVRFIMPFQVGPLEVIVLLIIVLVVFGPKRLPEMGRSLGRGIREFKGSLTKDDGDHSTASNRTAPPSIEPVKGEVDSIR